MYEKIVLPIINTKNFYNKCELFVINALLFLLLAGFASVYNFAFFHPNKLGIINIKIKINITSPKIIIK
jgi:hypothetical protein